MVWKAGVSGNSAGRPAGVNDRFTLVDVIDRLDRIEEKMRNFLLPGENLILYNQRMARQATHDGAPERFAQDMAALAVRSKIPGWARDDNGAPPDGSSLTEMEAAPLPADLRDGWSVVYRGTRGQEHMAEYVNGRYTIWLKNPRNDIHSDIPETPQPPDSKGGGVVDAATRNKMAPRNHVTFAGGQVPKAVADTLAKIRTADDDARRRAADVSEFYAREK